ncbi:uncharacterized protein LOC133805753 [Humulus lupulus]|uniref:uncharacterized protein LOC133805753 n=1 Tax=Humulus lupulus TaxID=3486 RepID=UPI002B406254|nr:uncharacterized protein LOC133805753 [Humulus lupulus]
MEWGQYGDIKRMPESVITSPPDQSSWSTKSPSKRRTSLQSHNHSQRGGGSKDDELDPRIEEDRALEPMEEIEEVCISDTNPTRVIRVGRNLNPEFRVAIVAREAVFPVWLPNPVLVPKPNGRWRTCIDFTDLNKVCPKDCFPLLRIDQMVDATSGYKLLSFMDAYSSYNQTLMQVAHQEHTNFQTDKGVYCYIFMSFRLKNARAKFQRLVNRMFRNLLL